MKSDKSFRIIVGIISLLGAWFFYELSDSWWLWTYVSVILGLNALGMFYASFLKD